MTVDYVRFRIRTSLLAETIVACEASVIVKDLSRNIRPRARI